VIEILDDDSQATIQDGGRSGWRRIGVGASGAMDALALERANLLCGNGAGLAAIEVPGTELRLRFITATRAAIVGADAPATLDGRALLPDSTFLAEPGAELRLARPDTGTYSYVAVQGGIDVPVVLGSRSTHLRSGFGGHEGRVLRRGDVLPIGRTGEAFSGYFALEPPRAVLALPGDTPEVTHVRVLPAAEHDALDDASRDAFWGTRWRISAQSNRAGYRLAGPVLRLAVPREMRSHGLLPGTIQAPDGGTPIIQLADAFTAGGYPKAGVVIAADLWRVAQAPLGAALAFLRVDYATALLAEDAFAAYRARTRMWIELWRGRICGGEGA
jgi:biotin-dependent carboxylase-like uncharacterized protein